MSLQEALDADRAGEIELAASRYEEVLAAGVPSVQVLLDLALLYWQATDVGLAAAKKLSSDFFAKAGRRFGELLEEAQRRFPESTEARFWKRYVAWADLGEPFDRNECKQLLQEDPASLVPVIFLLDADEGDAVDEEANELLHRCHKDGTTRARYVASVIEGIINRRVGYRH